MIDDDDDHDDDSDDGDDGDVFTFTRLSVISSS